MSPQTRRPIRVMTWNIHAGVGPDGRLDLDRVAAVIRRCDPDIVALQEVSSYGRAAGSRAFERLAAVIAAGHTVAAKTIPASNPMVPRRCAPPPKPS